MKKLERLRKEAVVLCNANGHLLKPFDRTYRHWWSSGCRVCNSGVCLNDETRANKTISGEALNNICEDLED